MGDFSIRNQFMFLSFELTKEERQIFDQYYTFLDKSGVAKIIGKHSKIFEVVPEFLKLKQQAEENLLSVKGIEIRVNRSIQAEGVFAVAKQDIRYTRIRRRGSKNVSTEIMLMFLGLNLKKLFNYFKTGKTPASWIAPKNLEPQQFKKPSAKRLSKKGRKINAKNYKIKQA